MTAISVGPASRSMPHWPKSWRLASATNRLPAPHRMSTGSTTPMPKAISAIAGTPPTTKMRSAPACFIALIVAGYQPAPFTGGVHPTTVSTPATFAGMMLICADPNIG
jgi:hypothetical protein